LQLSMVHCAFVKVLEEKMVGELLIYYFFFSFLSAIILY